MTSRVAGSTSLYQQPVALVLLSAFAISAGYTGFLALTGLLPAGLAAAYPPLWVFYLAGLGTAGLAAATDRAWARLAVAALIAVFIGVGFHLYSVLFVPGLQTTVGWFQNDIFIGLLVLAEYLCVKRFTSAG
jgi:hypothetical protein